MRHVTPAVGAPCRDDADGMARLSRRSNPSSASWTPQRDDCDWKPHELATGVFDGQCNTH
jgi:hypothetical protein